MVDVRRDDVERGPTLHTDRSWVEEYESLVGADRATGLDPEDLERLATAAYMVGRDEEQLHALERAHRGYLEAGEPRRAVRCAFWLMVHLLLRREAARARGWLGRVQRLLDREHGDCVERGYLILATEFQHTAAGDWAGALTVATAAAEVAERFGDADLLALALMDQGRSLIRLGRVGDGLGKLDEAMLEATANELSPIVAGLVYCSVIDGCHEVHELRRATEWTAAMSRWCDHQPGLVPFTGVCLIHRAELLQFHGEWRAALEQSRLARERFDRRASGADAGKASYRRGELLRLQGGLAEAEEAYHDASQLGCEPQPGLSLLRLAQGRTDAAYTAIAQTVAGTTEWVERARLLPAQVEIALAAGDDARAHEACTELEELAARYGSELLGAQAAQARGAVALASGDTRNAVLMLRRAARLWQELEAPYEGARVRVLLAQACRALGDDENVALELKAARATFEQLGAAQDITRVDVITRSAGSSDRGGLTERELQVLRLLSAGASNKAIAAELVLSTRTVDRHVSNIFKKLRVSSRAAATAYAYEHELI